MTPNGMTQLAVDATKSLIEILDAESEALGKSQVARVEQLLESKETAAEVFESRIKDISERPDILAQTAPAIRRDLRAAKERLDAAALQNAHALRAAMELNNRLVQRIAQSVERQRVAAAGYTGTGDAYARPTAGNQSDILPVSLDENL